MLTFPRNAMATMNIESKSTHSLARTFSIARDPTSDFAPFLIHGNFHTFAGRNCYARRSREKEQRSQACGVIS